MMKKIKGINCNQFRCPEFTVPVLSLLKRAAEQEEEVVISTKEPKAVNKVRHLCITHNWTLAATEAKADITFIKVQFAAPTLS